MGSAADTMSADATMHSTTAVSADERTRVCRAVHGLLGDAVRLILAALQVVAPDMGSMSLTCTLLQYFRVSSSLALDARCKVGLAFCNHFHHAAPRRFSLPPI